MTITTPIPSVFRRWNENDNIDDNMFVTPTSSIVRSKDTNISPPPPPDANRRRHYLRVVDFSSSQSSSTTHLPPPPPLTTFPDRFMLPPLRNDSQVTDEYELTPLSMMKTLSLRVNKKRRRLAVREQQQERRQPIVRQRSPPSLRPLDDPLDRRQMSKIMLSDHDDDCFINGNTSRMDFSSPLTEEETAAIHAAAAALYLEGNNSISKRNSRIKATSVARNSFSTYSSSTTSKRRLSSESIFTPIRDRS